MNTRRFVALAFSIITLPVIVTHAFTKQLPYHPMTTTHLQNGGIIRLSASIDDANSDRKRHKVAAIWRKFTRQGAAEPSHGANPEEGATLPDVGVLGEEALEPSKNEETTEETTEKKKEESDAYIVLNNEDEGDERDEAAELHARLWAAYSTEEAALIAAPGDAGARRRAADALCRWLRLSTDGNTVTVDGPGDRPAFRALWAEHAPRAVELYRGLGGGGKEDPDALCNLIESVSYASSAKGVARAALGGEAAAFLLEVARLTSAAPAHASGLAHVFAAAFYLAAPFPVRSPRRALAAAERALTASPKSRRNNYYAGLAALHLRWDFKRRGGGGEAAAVAQGYLEASLASDATAESEAERDIDGALRREAIRALEALRALEA